MPSATPKLEFRAINLVLPWPPSVNGYWRSVVIGGSPRVLISSDGRQYRQTVVGQLLHLAGRGFTTERLGVCVTLYPPTRRKFDLDNRLKALLDAMQHAGMYQDDGQIDEIRVRRGEVKPAGQCVVRLIELDNAKETA